MDNNIETLKSIAIKAGQIIMSDYKKDTSITIKHDKSPVTKADIASNDFIVSSLKELSPDIDIISEEIAQEPLKDINGQFWLVDPLDGTRGFIKQNDQFAVNIALINNQIPVLGIIYIPVSQELFYNVGGKSYKQVAGIITEIKVSNNKTKPVITLANHDKCSRIKEFIKKHDPSQVIDMSSSIKFCFIAEGKADIYPRFKRTMEWDSAAGHAIVNAAGGKVLDEDGNILTYGKENFENKGFVVYGYK